MVIKLPLFEELDHDDRVTLIREAQSFGLKADEPLANAEWQEVENGMGVLFPTEKTAISNAGVMYTLAISIIRRELTNQGFEVVIKE